MLNNSNAKRFANAEAEINLIYWKQHGDSFKPEEVEIELTFVTGEQQKLLISASKMNSQTLQKLEPRLTLGNRVLFDRNLQNKFLEARSDKEKIWILL